MEDQCRLFCNSTFETVWEEKNYCERRNELSSWRPEALPNRHIHLYLFKLGYGVYVLLSSVMYIFSGEKITAVFTISRCRWDQNTTQVANRLDRARATYVRLLHVPPCYFYSIPLCTLWAIPYRAVDFLSSIICSECIQCCLSGAKLYF